MVWRTLAPLVCACAAACGGGTTTPKLIGAFTIRSAIYSNYIDSGATVVKLTDYDDACGKIFNGDQAPRGHYLQFGLSRANQPVTGTSGTDDYTLISSFLFLYRPEYHQIDASCSDQAVVRAYDGDVMVTSADASSITGSFNLSMFVHQEITSSSEFNTADTLSGSFVATQCGGFTGYNYCL